MIKDSNKLNIQIAEALNPSKLHLIILPTERCNFRCTYCYEDFAIGKMKKPIQDAIVNFSKKRISDLKNFQLDWFGGEPLLAKNVIYYIMSEVLASVNERGNINFNSEITTNAYLLDIDTFEKLINLKVTNYQITLDGTLKFHNQTRIKADGSGTFKKIWNNLIKIKNSSHNFHITLRVHITNKNVLDIQELLNQINESFGDDSRFSVFLKPVEALGSINDETFNFLPNNKKLNTISLLNSLLNKSLQSPPSTGNYVCYASKGNSFVIRSNGSINKCTVALNDERNDIGKIELDGSLTLNNSKMKLWMTGLQTQESQMLSCPNSLL